jgi:hypothetical protein
MVINAILEAQQTREFWQLVGEVADMMGCDTLTRNAWRCASYEARAAAIGMQHVYNNGGSNNE